MLALIISLANLPLRGKKKAADSDLLHFVFHAEKEPEAGKRLPRLQIIGEMHFSDGEILKARV